MACFGGGAVTGHCIPRYPINIALTLRTAAAMVAVRENSCSNGGSEGEQHAKQQLQSKGFAVQCVCIGQQPRAQILGSGFWTQDLYCVTVVFTRHLEPPPLTSEAAA